MKTPLLNLISSPTLYDFFFKKMVLFWFSLTAFLATLFRLIFKYQEKSDEIVVEKQEEVPELEVIDYEDSEYEGFEEKDSDETPKFSFKFQFQPYEDVEVTRRSTEDLTASTSKYEFLTEKVSSGYVVKPEVVSFSVQEFYSEGSEDNKEIIDDGFLSEKDFMQTNLGKEDGNEEIVSNLYSGEDIVLIDNPLFEKEESFTGNSVEKEENYDETGFVSENELVSLDYDPESIHLWDRFSVMVNFMDSNEDGFLSDDDFDHTGVQLDDLVELEDRKAESTETVQNSERTHMEDVQDSDKYHLETPIALEEITSPNFVNMSKEMESTVVDEEERSVEISSPTSVNMSKEELAVMDEVSELINDIPELEGLNLPSSSNLETDPEIEREYYELQAKCQLENSDGLNLLSSSNLETDPEIEKEYYELQAKCQLENSDELGGNMDLDTERVLDDGVQNQETDTGEFLEVDATVSKHEEVNFLTAGNLESDADIEREYQEMKAKVEKEYSSREETKEADNLDKLEESHKKDASLSVYEESDSLESLWEHQEMIEQLKMELRKVRAIGLPTIYEESESPRVSVEDLKPWKIDENFVHEDQINEHHKFYKGYRERMRKLDILNYQKMYAMGFYLQLKDPVKSTSTKKVTAPTSASVLSQNFFLPKNRKPEANLSMKFMKEVESELELVYVGQMCLSWEFLHWQYGKAKELVLSDKYETRAYNQVAGEFQQFQVLMQRFIEKESFEGPRIPTYIKNRCDLRNLLEVPVIKEDIKDKEGRERSKSDITCSMLLDIMEESMHIFWEFVRADRHDGIGNVLLKGFSVPQGKLLNNADTELWMDIQKDLQKKKKKLKEILKTGNCIVRKFQKHHKEEPDQLLFFSQVDLKLVARVLRMSRVTTDQLGWCHEKLRRIQFVNRKIHVEPSFLLFPC